MRAGLCVLDHKKVNADFSEVLDLFCSEVIFCTFTRLQNLILREFALQAVLSYTKCGKHSLLESLCALYLSSPACLGLM